MSKVADAYARGEAKECAYRVHVPALIDVRAIRAKLGMTQEEFAGRFGFSVNTLRHWEQGKRQPEGPTRAYLLSSSARRRRCRRRCTAREGMAGLPEPSASELGLWSRNIILPPSIGRSIAGYSYAHKGLKIDAR